MNLKRLFDIDYKVYIILALSAIMLVNLVIFSVSKNKETQKEVKEVREKVNQIDSNVLFFPVDSTK
jgi:uncharacterized protein YoxC